MDPLHPIIPIPPNIPSVTPAPMMGRVDRDSSRAGAGQDQRRRRRPPAAPGTTDYDEFDYAVEETEGEDDSGLHINVTA